MTGRSLEQRTIRHGLDADKYASMKTVAVKKWLQVEGVMPAVGEETAVVAADVAVAAKNHVKKYPVSSFPGNKTIAYQI